MSVQDNPVRYGTASASGAAIPYLGSSGGPPRAGNASFGVRIGGTPGAGGVLLLGVRRGNVATPSGPFLLDPDGPLVVVASLALPDSGSTHVRLPLAPASAGATVNLQAVLFTAASPLRVELTAGLEVTVQ
jgi:hypothetical protein